MAVLRLPTILPPLSKGEFLEVMHIHSLAHHEILFLDKAPGFRKNVLQSLREPIEAQKVIISQARMNVWYSASLEVVTMI